MKQITSRELQLNLSKYLNELPIEITRYYKVVAVLVSPEKKDESKDELNKKYIKDLENRIKELEDQLPKTKEEVYADLGISIGGKFMQNHKVCDACHQTRYVKETDQGWLCQKCIDELEINQEV